MRWLPESARSRWIAVMGAAMWILGLIIGFLMGDWRAAAALIALGLIVGLYAERKDRLRA